MLKTAIGLSLGLVLMQPLVPAAQASPLGLTPRDTYALVQEQGDAVLFIDVRDPVEIMFVGSTDVVDANIPFQQVNRNRWDAENNRNARYVVNGFQGDRLSEGDQAGMRLKNGWQNSGLPWSPRLNPAKIYRTDR